MKTCNVRPLKPNPFGVGRLLAGIRDGIPYFPCYDNNGNITRYLDASGATVAAYTYGAFGQTVTATGPLADAFPHRFSTKHFDPETGLYYYGYRYYSPTLMRWLNRDPIEEDGGMNLYAFCANCSSCRIDIHGKNIYLYTGNSSGNEINDLFHQAVAVDVWSDDCPPRLIGRESFSFGTDFQEGNANLQSNWLGTDSIVIPGNTYIGRIYKPAEIVGMMERRKRTTVQEDRDWLEAMNRRWRRSGIFRPAP